MMRWIRNNFMVLVFLAAIATSFIIAQRDASQRDRNIIKAAVSVCERTSNGTAYDVVFKFLVARDARQRGSDVLAVASESAGRGKLRTLPAPPGLGPDEESLRRLIATKKVDGRLVLTKQAVALQRAGCVGLFK